MFVYKLVTNKFFDIAVSLIIFLNVISMAVEHYQMSDVSSIQCLLYPPLNVGHLKKKTLNMDNMKSEFSGLLVPLHMYLVANS